MLFKVLSRNEIQRFQTFHKHIVISVSDPNSEEVPMPSDVDRLGTLRLSFHDWDAEQMLKFATTYKDVLEEMVFFSADMAKEILSFVEKYRDKVDLIVCQCEAGISRSAGIAAALSKIINGDDSVFFKRYIPNSLVYSQILRSWMITECFG